MDLKFIQVIESISSKCILYYGDYGYSTNNRTFSTSIETANAACYVTPIIAYGKNIGVQGFHYFICANIPNIEK